MHAHVLFKKIYIAYLFGNIIYININFSSPVYKYRNNKGNVVPSSIWSKCSKKSIPPKPGFTSNRTVPCICLLLLGEVETNHWLDLSAHSCPEFPCTYGLDLCNHVFDLYQFSFIFDNPLNCDNVLDWILQLNSWY